MSSRREDERRIEIYARALMEAGQAGERANSDLEQFQSAVSFSPEVLETICAMNENGDLRLMREVAHLYKELLDAEDGTVSVKVTTAVPMDDDLRASVKAKAEKDMGRPVFLVEEVDPSILGGIIIEARGRRQDASVRAQLATIKKTLSSTFIGGDEQ